MGKKAFENGRLIQSSKNVSLKESLILTTDENRIRKSNYQTSWNKLSESIAYHRTWGDCYGYYLVCSGKAQVMFDVGLKPCDILPLIPIIRGAGCEIVELRKPYQDIIVCSREMSIRGGKLLLMERAKGFEPRHPPWQGGALPTELRPRLGINKKSFILKQENSSFIFRFA